MGIAKGILRAAIFILIAICIVGSGSVKAQNVEYVGSTLWGNCQGLTVSGDYAYGGYLNGLIVFDISDPGNPTDVGRLYYHTTFEDDLFDIALYGDYAYVIGFGYNILSIVDVSDPTSPSLVRDIELSDSPLGIFVQGNYFYLVKEGAGQNLQILNITDPIDPVFVGGANTPGTPYDIFISGDYAYLAARENGLEVFDISDPTNPTYWGGCDTGDWNTMTVFVSGNYAYLIAVDLYIVDVSIPSNPVVVSVLDDLFQPRAVFVSGDYAYLSDGGRGLTILNISDPANPVKIGEYRNGINGNSIIVDGNYAYLSDDHDGIFIIDVSNLELPVEAGRYVTANYLRTVSVSGNHAYVSDVGVGLHIVDITEPSDPVLTATYLSDIEGNDGVGDVFISGNYAYIIVRYPSRLEIVDISDPQDPIYTGSCNIDDLYGSIFVYGDHALIGGWPTGYHIADISDPVNPILVFSGETTDSVEGIFVMGDYAYLAGGFGLQILNISNPADPELTGIDDDHSLRGVYILDDYAYSAGSGLFIFDISNPSFPSLTGSCVTGSRAYSVVVEDDFAYVADKIKGLKVVNVIDKTNPAVIGGYNTPGESFGVFKYGDMVYLTDYYSLMILEPRGFGRCNYVVGDYNANLAFNVADIISAFSKLKTGSPEPGMVCECPYGSGDVWAVAMDVNNSCSFNVADVIAGFSKLKTGSPELVSCELCPPG
ncbi:MAG: hypothetical protein V3W18_05055 [candidate division Zixibacteria bacterium]